MSSIRKANLEDLSRMAEILIFTKRMNYREIFKDDHVSFGEMQDENIYWVYEDDFVKGLMSIKGTQLRELYVDHFFEGEGIGGMLIEYAKEVFGVDHLWVLEKNIRGRAFYKRHGFYASGKKKLEEGTSEYILEYVRSEK